MQLVERPLVLYFVLDDEDCVVKVSVLGRGWNSVTCS